MAPIDTAIQIGNRPIELLLGSAGVDAGSTPRSRTELLSSAMTGALARHDPAAVAALLRLGANPNARHPQLGVPLLPWDMSSANSRKQRDFSLKVAPTRIRSGRWQQRLAACHRQFIPRLGGLDATKRRKSGADQRPWQLSPYCVLWRTRAVELVKSMRSRGASLDIQDAHGLTALMRLAGDGREREVVALCDLETNPDADLTPKERHGINTGDT